MRLSHVMELEKTFFHNVSDLLMVSNVSQVDVFRFEGVEQKVQIYYGGFANVAHSLGPSFEHDFDGSFVVFTHGQLEAARTSAG